MFRVIEPPRDQHFRLRQPLTNGESRVFEFFDSLLAPEWEIYLQPHLNGLRPDFVLLNPYVGIAVFEIKDWSARTLAFDVNRKAGSTRLREEVPDSAGSRIGGSPLVQLNRYKEGILELYCPRLGINTNRQKNFAVVVTAGLIMTGISTEEAIKRLDPDRLLSGRENENSRHYNPITGKDALDANDIALVFPESQRKSSYLMDGRLANDLRSWLVEPSFSIAQRQPLELDDAQKRLVTYETRTQSGSRRLRGAAGSGKSVVLAARSAWLSARKRDVLVVTFNITLWHYLRDLAVRYPAPARALNDYVTWLHFHEWCKRVCFDAGLESEYSEMWRSHFEAGGNEESLENVLRFEMPTLTSRAVDLGLANGTINTYDAILVDEGQDFSLDWWNLLRKVCRTGGELLLVADRTQDLYGQARFWTDERMTGAGFSGRWNTLDVSYRPPAAMIPYLQAFVRNYLDPALADPPATRQLAFDKLDPVQIRWWQIRAEDDQVEASVKAILQMPCLAYPDIMAFTDVTFLAEDNKTGLSCVVRLEERRIKVAHTFGVNSLQSRSRKLGFYMGDGRVKATTIKSFKGWESRALVVQINRANNYESCTNAYVAISRLKAHTSGSFITVVCSAPELEAFGRTMPGFENLKGQFPRILTADSTQLVPPMIGVLGD